MGWGRDQQSLIEYAEANPLEERETGFAENMEASFDASVASDLSISRYVMDAPRRERNAEIDKLVDSGELKADQTVEMQPYGYTKRAPLDYDALAKQAQEKGLDGFKSDEELYKESLAETKRLDDERKDISSRATGLGSIGGVVGDIGASAVDPVNIATMLIPAAGPAATLLTRASVSAATGLATELAIQPQLMGWKQEAGIDYTMDDAINNAVINTITGVGLGEGLHQLGKLVGFGKSKITDKKLQGHAADMNEGLKAAVEPLEQQMKEVKKLPIEHLPDDIQTIGDINDIADNYAVQMEKEIFDSQPPIYETVVDADMDKAVDTDFNKVMGDEYTQINEEMQESSKRLSALDADEAMDPEAKAAEREQLTKELNDKADRANKIAAEKYGEEFAMEMKDTQATHAKIEETLTCLLGGGPNA